MAWSLYVMVVTVLGLGVGMASAVGAFQARAVYWGIFFVPLSFLPGAMACFAIYYAVTFQDYKMLP